MKKKMLKRGALGFPLGIAIGYLITVGLSLAFGQGYYTACAPELIEAAGSEIRAVVVQTFLCGFLGTISGAGSLIWEVEEWNLVQKTVVFFLVLSVPMAFIAYFMHWMEHSVSGILGYFAIFAGIFVMDWIIQYIVNRRNVEKMNARLKGNQAR